MRDAKAKSRPLPETAPSCASEVSSGTPPAGIWLPVWLGILVSVFSGCRAYNLGNQSLFRPDVRTVHVEAIESESFRRFLGQRLSESIAKQITLSSNLRIAPANMADSTIRGRILGDRKIGLTESVNDDLRDISSRIRVELSWVDRYGRPLMDRTTLVIDEADHFVPEGGQSLTTAQQDTIDRIARQVVQQMEMPW